MSSESSAVPEGWKYELSDNFITESRVKGSTGDVARKITVKLYGKGVFEKIEKRAGSDKTQYFKRSAGQFIYSKLDALNGAFGIIPSHLDGLESTVDLPTFNFLDGVCDSWFLQYVSRSEFYDTLAMFGNGGRKARRISPSDFYSVELLTPPLPEQQKIASILSSVDDVITKTTAQIDKLKDLKTGMMQELLTKGIGHTEFKDSPVGRIPVEWDVVELNQLIHVMESGWSPQCDPEPAGTGEWGVLKTTAVTWNGFNYRANKKLPDTLEPRPAIQVQPDDILITRAGPAERVGVVVYVGSVPDRIMLSDKLIRLKSREDIDSQFLSYWLSGEYVKNFFALRTTGLAQSQTNISQEILKGVPCIAPPVEEQLRISRAIAGIEENTGLYSERLKQYQSLKKALMQDLLTGKVRVSVDS